MSAFFAGIRRIFKPAAWVASVPTCPATHAHTPQHTHARTHYPHAVLGGRVWFGTIAYLELQVLILEWVPWQGLAAVAPTCRTFHQLVYGGDGLSRYL